MKKKDFAEFIRIRDRRIGRRYPAFIIAEAGINHNGKLELAKKLIREAKAAGADAVKFQTFKAQSLCSKESRYFNLFKSLEFDKNAWQQIAKLARRLGIIFLSTPFDEESVDLLNDLNIPAFKVASGDLTHLPLLKYIATKQKPILLSTGMANLKEINEALNVIYANGNNKVILLHCVSNYPTDIKYANLKAICTLGQAFGVPVGFSDHTIGTLASIAAVCLGAKVIERHFTLSKNLPGPDHRLSLNPEEFKTMVKQIRSIEQGLGDGKKVPSRAEGEIKAIARRSIVADIDIPKGTIITRQMLKISRPGTGIQPKFLERIIGKDAKRNIKQDEVLNWSKIT